MEHHKLNCLVCGSSDYSKKGIRGNREYSGADPNATPHLVTDVLKCNNCGFYFTAQLPEIQSNLEADHYADTVNYIGISEATCFERIKIIQEEKPNASILDIGAGKGVFIKAASDCGFDVCGIEPSEEFAKYASKISGKEVVHGYLDKLGLFGDRKFDVITLFHVMEHVEDPHHLLSLIKSYLSEDSMLLVEVPNSEGTLLTIIDWYYKLKGLNWSSRLSPYHNPFHKFGYSEKSMKQLLERNGFEVTKVITLSGFQREMENRDSQSKVEVFLRNLVMKAIDLFSNRELLLVLAKPVS